MYIYSFWTISCFCLGEVLHRTVVFNFYISFFVLTTVFLILFYLVHNAELNSVLVLCCKLSFFRLFMLSQHLFDCKDLYFFGFQFLSLILIIALPYVHLVFLCLISGVSLKTGHLKTFKSVLMLSVYKSCFQSGSLANINCMTGVLINILSSFVQYCSLEGIQNCIF